MAKHLRDLCSLLIEDTYGELPASIFKTLARSGRITLSALIQQSDLSGKHIRHGLTVLIQQHLILHFTPDNESMTYYEVDWDGAYNLVRSGKIVATVEDRYGAAAGQVVSNLLQLGHARVGDLEDVYRFDTNQPAINSAAVHINGEGMPNGIEKGHLAVQPQDKKISSRQDLHKVLFQLLEAGFVTKVHERTYQSSADREMQMEKVVKESDFPDGKTTGPKARERFVVAMNERKRKWREEELDISKVAEHSAANGHGPQKRQRLDNGGPNGVGGHARDDIDGPWVTLQRELVVRPNFDKCAVAMRSQQFEKYATRYFGDTIGKVYGTLLLLLEKKLYRCREEPKVEGQEEDEGSLPSTTTVDVLDELDRLHPSLDLVAAIAANDNLEALMNGHAQFKTENHDDDDGAPSAMKQRNARLNVLEQHLRVLAEHPRGFLDRVGTRGKGEWSVHFNTLTETLQAAEIDNVITARLGTVFTRVARLLRQKGKLEQKSVEEGCLMRKKDAMSVLANMQEAGFVETQEVPKDNSRQPSRSIYLWFFNQERVAKLLLFDVYKVMTRLVERIQVQKSFRQEVIAKAERLDVVGHEDEYLTAGDRVHLREWREEEEKLLTQLMRLDDMVALLRDF